MGSIFCNTAATGGNQLSRLCRMDTSHREHSGLTKTNTRMPLPSAFYFRFPLQASAKTRKKSKVSRPMRLPIRKRNLSGSCRSSSGDSRRRKRLSATRKRSAKRTRQWSESVRRSDSARIAQEAIGNDWLRIRPRLKERSRPPGRSSCKPRTTPRAAASPIRKARVNSRVAKRSFCYKKRGGGGL